MPFHVETHVIMNAEKIGDAEMRIRPEGQAQKLGQGQRIDGEPAHAEYNPSKRLRCLKFD